MTGVLAERSISARRLTIGVGALASLFLVRSVTVGTEWPGLSNAVRDFVTLSLSVVIESLPFVFLGIVISTFVQVWLPSGFVPRVLPRASGRRRGSVSVLGLALPVCECGNVPLARGLVSEGVRVSDAVTFLLAAPIVNPVTIITTHQAFGWNDSILVARIGGGLLIANLVGWVLARHPTPSSLLTTAFDQYCHNHQSARATDQWRASATTFAEETSAILPALFVGAGVAGVIQVLVPRSVLVSVGSDPLWSVVALMALAFVVSVCSNVDAFFILAFGATFLPGAVVGFLVFGAMIDIKMVALLRTTFTARAVATITMLVGLSTLALGLGVNLIA